MHLDERSAHLHGHGPDQRRRLRLHGQRRQRGRHRSELTGLGHGHPAHRPRRAHHPHGHARQCQATLTWTAPSSDGGSAITAYTVVAGDETTPANGGESCTWTSGPLTCTVTGLTNGDAYIFGMSATNEVGTSVTSVLLGPVTPPSGDWTQSTPADSPSPRATASEAWDPATGQLILFGGGECSGVGGGCTVTNDTWSWTGTTWAPLTPSSSPPPLAEASLAYDPAAGQLVLFGGIDSNGDSLSSTWVWSGSNWSLGISNFEPTGETWSFARLRPDHGPADPLWRK